MLRSGLYIYSENMKIVLFDDPKSLLHTILGVFTPLLPKLFIAFLMYEVIETLYKEEEKKGEFLGDLIEYLMGIAIYVIYSIL